MTEFYFVVFAHKNRFSHQDRFPRQFGSKVLTCLIFAYQSCSHASRPCLDEVRCWIATPNNGIWFMMTSLNGNVFRVIASPWLRQIPSQRPVMRRFDVFFVMRLNNLLIKNRDTGHSSCHHAHYDVTVMCNSNDFCRNFEYPIWGRVQVWK